MGRTHEIPREQWPSFFGAVARTEYDRRVRIEVDEEGLGSQPLAEHVPLVGLSLEKRGSDDVDVTVRAGQGGFEHRIASARRLTALEGDDGDLRCLDIESSDGTAHALHTRVCFE